MTDNQLLFILKHNTWIGKNRLVLEWAINGRTRT